MGYTRNSNKWEFSVEEIAGSDDETIRQLVCLEEKCCPLEMRNVDSHKYFSEVLKDPKRIALALKYKNRLVGFLLAREYEKIYSDLCNHDPELEECKKEFFYIETIHINPRYYKDKKGLKLLVHELNNKAQKDGLSGFCTYARTKNGLSSLLKKYFKGEKLRSIDNWLGFDEKFDYLEVRIDNNI